MFGPEHERLPPVRHRAGRVEPRRFGKRAAGLGMVEAVGEVQALVDEQLRARRLGRDLEGVRAQVLQPRREHAAGARLVRRVVALVVLMMWRLGDGDRAAQNENAPRRFA